MCAYQPCLTTSKEHALNKQYALNNPTLHYTIDSTLLDSTLLQLQTVFVYHLYKLQAQR